VIVEHDLYPCDFDRPSPIAARTREPSRPRPSGDQRTKITVAVVGAGMAGQAHPFGYRNATMHVELAGVDVQLSTIVDFDQRVAASMAGRYGFARATTDLNDVLGDYAIDAVSLAFPNVFYSEVIP
jgi:predicted dehydrogenase